MVLELGFWGVGLRAVGVCGLWVGVSGFTFIWGFEFGVTCFSVLDDIYSPKAP